MAEGNHKLETTTTLSDDTEKRSKFGTRYLTDPKSVFQHNAWDNVSWDEEQEAAARDIATKQAQKAVSQEKKDEYEQEAATFWDKFYGVHSNHFFKDRHWLFTEFPELYGGLSPENIGQSPTVRTENKNDAGLDTENCESDTILPRDSHITAESEQRDSDKQPAAVEPSSSFSESAARCHAGTDTPFKLLEVGCGVGNTVFPVLKTNKNQNLTVYCCDFSSTAIDIVKAHPDYDQKRCLAFVHDITDTSAEVPIEEGSLDVIVMIFVLSAVCPEKMQAAVDRLASYLKPGGIFLFRDYGRYDMAQLRFKEGRCLSENFYVRGDGTRVYFFTQDELRSMFERAGLVEKENLVDRRLQVNRGRQLKMYRVWIQCKYMKP